MQRLMTARTALSQSLLLQGAHLTSCTASRRRCQGLNPFYFRALILRRSSLRRIAGRVSIPSTSGRSSYFIWIYQCLTILRRLNPFYFRALILPGRAKSWTSRRCLNPFYFRALILRDTKDISAPPGGLNPFYFRALILLVVSYSHHRGDGRLNPFYFRALILPHQPAKIKTTICRLNPFYFRALILRGLRGERMRSFWGSQSLLLQGAHLTKYEAKHANYTVSIPSTSGRSSYSLSQILGCGSSVSIPSTSGRSSYSGVA